ncbi:MAG: ferrous iron transport protein B [Formivibrio sp.]|nr:ferrous iron transport protein B [Formivibrio sp.]
MKKIALVGMPNTGKSTLFNRLTGGAARVANWPGLTVDITTGKILLGSFMVHVADLPGIYDLEGGAEDEQLAQAFLAETDLDAVVLVLNAMQLDRQLALALQLKALGAPLVVLLNMADEARAAGIQIDLEGLSAELACPVYAVCAKHGEGMPEFNRRLAVYLKNSQPHRVDFSTLTSNADWHTVEASLCARFVNRPPTLPAGPTVKLDRWVLHPLAGLPIFVVMMFCLFQLTYAIGSPLQGGLGFLLGLLKSNWLVPLTQSWPAFLSGFLVDGVFDGVTTVVTFAPIIFLFFSLMAIIEDSGYFSRAAFMMDGLMSRIGLDGRGFVMLMMGFGCNVPALMGTRVIRDYKARLLTMLIIPFSLCSARLQIFLFLSGALFSPTRAPWVLLSLYLASIGIAMATALLFRKYFPSREPFALELPPYRLPVIGHVWRRGWGETREFLKLASTMIVTGVALVWLLTHYPNEQASFASMIATFFQPVLSPIGIRAELSIALLFGFVAKEIVLGALSVIVGHQGVDLATHLANTLDGVSAYSFMLFTLIYIPCVSAIATLRKESKSLAFTGFSVLWSLGVAWMISFTFYQGARLLGF